MFTEAIKEYQNRSKEEQTTTKKGGENMLKSEIIFIYKWLIAVFVGVVALFIGVIGFIINYLEMGIVFSLFSGALFIWYIFFVPHTFIFDNDKITVRYVFKTKSIRYAYIKNIDKEESGVRNYPWGTYYRIIWENPCWQELKIPSTKKIDLQIKKYLQSRW